jgi:transposase InsO family protein
MKALYDYLGISKQAHAQSVERELQERSKEPCYIGFIETIRDMHPAMGLRAMYEQFEPEGIGRDAFITLGLRYGYRVKAPESPMKTTISVKSARFRNLLADVWLTDVNQVWVSDLFYFRVGEKHYYVVLIMDVYSRQIVGYSVADNMRAENNIAALRMALELRGIKNYNQTLIHHSDRGVQYTSDAYTELLAEYGLRVSMCSDVLENAHCERANGTIKNSYLALWNPKTEEELFKMVPTAVQNYNDRNHSSLTPIMTPLKFETYVKELPLEKRTKFQMFTIKQNVSNSIQLSLF